MEAHTQWVLIQLLPKVSLRFEAGWLKLEAIHLLMKSTSMSLMSLKMWLWLKILWCQRIMEAKEVAKKTTCCVLDDRNIKNMHKMTAVFFMCWLSFGVSFFSPKSIKDFTCSWLISGIRDAEDFRLNAYEITIFCWGVVVDKVPSNWTGCPLAFTAPGSIRKTSLAISKPTNLWSRKVVNSSKKRWWAIHRGKKWTIIEQIDWNKKERFKNQKRS